MRRTTRGTRAVRQLRRRERVVTRVLIALALVSWALVVWKTLRPPMDLEVPPPDTEDMVHCVGGRLETEASVELEQVGPFYLDRFEVTREEFAAFLASHPDFLPPGDWRGLRSPPRGTEQWPVSQVSLGTARVYAAWRGKRVPTSHEWEWAARGALSLRFPWGDGTQTFVANTRRLGLFRPTPVGLFESGKSPPGAYDMVGNVAEWTETRVPGVLNDRFFIRGGSFRDEIQERGGPSIMQMRQLNGENEWEWIPWRVDGAGSQSVTVGFRCALDIAKVEERYEIRRLVLHLGARDPITYWLETRPALRRLREMGGPAVPVLEYARARAKESGVRGRLEDLIRDIGATKGRS